MRNLKAIIDDFGPDVIHAHNWIVHSLTPLRRRSGVPLLLTLHNYGRVCATHRFMYRDQSPCSGPAPSKCLGCSSVHYGRVRGALTTAALAAVASFRDSRIDHVIAVSGAVAKHNALAQSMVPWSVIPNFVPERLVGQVRAPPSELADALPEVYILFTGELHRQKGLYVLLEAYDRLLPDRRPALVCLGKQTDVPPGPLPAGAIVVGPWPHDDVMAAVRRCAFSVVPSTWPDPCPTTVLEAMAAGKATIGTATGGITDMIEHGASGLLVEPGNVDQLSDAMENLEFDVGRRKQLGEAAIERVRAFTDKRVVNDLEKVYESVTSQRVGVH
jgi:glycosyltransferase involved in cell wall biosynthesis